MTLVPKKQNLIIYKINQSFKLKTQFEMYLKQLF